VPADADYVCQLEIPAGLVVDLTVSEQQSLAGFLRVLAADGRVLVGVDLSRRSAPARRVLIPPGADRIAIAPATHGSLERVFLLSTDAPRMPTEADLLRMNAERVLGEGEQTYRQRADGALESAVATYERSLATWTSMGDSARQADLLIHIGWIRYELGDTKAALDAFRRALDAATLADDRSGMGGALQAMAQVGSESGQPKEADEWASRALEIQKGIGDVRGQAASLFILASLRVIGGKSDDAYAMDSEVAALAQRAGDRLREADAVISLGIIEAQRGRRSQAIERYSAALTIARTEQDVIREAQCLSNLGASYYNLGEIRTAIRYLEEALPLRKRVSGPNGYGNTLYNLALDHVEIGEYQKARDEYTEALDLFRHTRYPRGEGFVLRSLGDLYMITGEDTKAAPLLNEAASKWRSIGDRRGEVLALQSLSDLAARRHDMKGADALLRQAIDVASTAGFKREEAQGHGRLAALARTRAEWTLAAEEAGRQLDLSRETGDRLGQADALHQQGAAWRRLRAFEQARTALAQAQALREAAGTRLPLAATLDELARVDLDSGDADAAGDRIARALDLIDAVEASAGNRESRMRFAAAHRRSFDLAIDVAMQRGRTAEAFELSERARTRGFVDMIRESRVDIREGVDPELLARERDVQERLDAKHDRFERLLGSAHSPAQEADGRRELDALVASYQAVEAEIVRRSPRYAALMQPRPLALTDVQKRLLDRDTALVEFWLGEDRSYAFVVTRTACRGFTLPPAKDIAPVVGRAYRALNARNRNPAEAAEARSARLDAADREFEQAAAKLSRTLFAPMRGGLSARRLLVVSDGELQYLPMAALPWPGTAEPLAARYEIVHLPSASVLSVVRDAETTRARPSKKVAVFADPVFRADDQRLTSPHADRANGDVTRAAEDAGIGALARLPFSRREADAIVALAPGALAVTDFDATRAAAKQPSLAGYRIVHFATHGLLDSRHPELSGIVLSMVDRRGRSVDGFLRLHEIYNLKLNADLVVLSACQTALGQEVRSEGLVGLVRGFMYAGSPQVVASLWSVRDRAAAELMRALYENLLTRNASPEAALRAAQLAMRADPRWRAPYFWAAFTVQGAR